TSYQGLSFFLLEFQSIFFNGFTGDRVNNFKPPPTSLHSVTSPLLRGRMGGGLENSGFAFFWLDNKNLMPENITYG
ncbi:MAG TPA: hypothetical protein P5346_14390, partial [Spirochaetota bacterium]|nr:hypothetical protein [Spirochaetota bacterium]